MLSLVELEAKRFKDYQPIIDPQLYEDVLTQAAKLKGARILQINSTASGGGVAEILRSEVPLLRDLGVNAHWQVLEAGQDFFEVTKMIHNGLQGQEDTLTLDKWETYQQYNRQLSAYIQPGEWDFIIIHDPQPAAVLSYFQDKGGSKWIWRDHIDSRHAGGNFILRFATYLKPYDGMIFTQEKYIFDGLAPKKLAIIPVAIDPLSVKNRPLDAVVAHKLVENFGINAAQPMVVQVSRFDPWKDPLGVIQAWQLAKSHLPELQLALIGQSSVDDPESILVLDDVLKVVKGLKNISVIANKADDRDVHAFFQSAVAGIQKSIREGFGLTVSEALWAGTPVVGSNIGGIPEQIQEGTSGYLVETIEEAAERIVELVKNPQQASQMGKAGHEYVRQHFLLPRLIRDDLKFLNSF